MGKKRSKNPAKKPATKPRPQASGKRRVFLFLILSVLAAGGLFMVPQTRSWLNDLRYGPQKLETTSVRLPNGDTLSVELARTPHEQEVGLMFRKSLAPDRGMLFVYNTESTHTFWMKNTVIDLDMVFIGADKKVLSVAARVPRTTSDTPDDEIPRRSGRAQYILEIGAGRAAELGLVPGSPLVFDTRPSSP